MSLLRTLNSFTAGNGHILHFFSPLARYIRRVRERTYLTVAGSDATFSEMAETAPSRPKRQGRSPNYPGIDLKLALERARTLWDREQHHSAPNEIILRHWGYGPKSGGGSVAFAALKRFGLLDDLGGAKARLSERAQAILLAEREGRRDDGLIRAAALAPALHQELWQRYGPNFPSHETLKFELMTGKGFTQGGAAEFVSEYKRTLKFAGLTEPGATMPPDEPNESPKEPEITPPASIAADPEDSIARGTPPPKARGVRTVQVTYSPSEWALLQAPFPMTEDDWDAMIDVLKAMKRGLVSKPSPGDSSTPA